MLLYYGEYVVALLEEDVVDHGHDGVVVLIVDHSHPSNVTFLPLNSTHDNRL